MNQSPEDQFLLWRHDMERKQEEQAKQMKKLQGHVERLQCENDQLRAQIGKSRDPENMHEITVELRIQSPTIKGRSPLFLTMSIPQ